VKKEYMDTCEGSIRGSYERLSGLLTDTSKHEAKLKYMRLLIEAGRERKERKSIEGRCMDSAIRLVVNILPTHTAACNVFGTMRNE
jgi:hypothetical protein